MARSSPYHEISPVIDSRAALAHFWIFMFLLHTSPTNLWRVIRAKKPVVGSVKGR